MCQLINDMYWPSLAGLSTAAWLFVVEQMCTSLSHHTPSRVVPQCLPWSLLSQALTTMLKDTLSEVRETVAAKRAELESLPLLHSRVDLMCYSR